MRVCIHRGAKEVGGTCIEIETQGKRLVLDLGQPLGTELNRSSLPLVKGFTGFDDSLLGLFISHPHLDHYGLVGKINPDIPIFIGAAAKRIINSAKKFFPNGINIDNSIDLKHLQRINLGPFILTPYLVDHSAYDSYALLVEADSKRLFYTGDFRAHGRKSGLVEKLLANPPKEVNALLMEGTTIDRIGIDAQYPSENDLEEKLVWLLKEAKGLTLLWTSGQNIDRLVTAYKACRQTGKIFIVDMYTAGILRAIENPRIPQPGFSAFKVFLPWFQKKKIIDQKLFDCAKSFSSCRIYPEQLKEVAYRSVMLFRPSMMMDLLKADCLKNAELVYSLWSGYLQDSSSKRVLNWLEQNNIPLLKWHTSGHASVQDLKRLSEGIKPKMLIPIHSFEPQSYLELFENVSLKADGEWWDVA